jgi:hypothetical protein
VAANSHDNLLSMYVRYLDERGYQAVKIPETTTKTPDLEVSGRESGTSYLNEFKSPDFLPDTRLGLYKYTTTNSKLLQFVHTAIKQFKAHDPSHCNPWVITFASRGLQLNWNTLFEAMQGGIVIDGRVLENWTGARVFRQWTQDRYVVDLYTWLQVNGETPYQASFFTNERSPHRPQVDEFVRKLHFRPLSSVDNNILLP